MRDHESDRAAEVLRKVASLLERYGIEDRATFVRSVINTETGAIDWALVSGLEFWGGSGAVWEIEPFEFSHPSDARSAEDTRDFYRALVELSDLLAERTMADLSGRNADLLRRMAESR